MHRLPAELRPWGSPIRNGGTRAGLERGDALGVGGRRRTNAGDSVHQDYMPMGSRRLPALSPRMLHYRPSMAPMR